MNSAAALCFITTCRGRLAHLQQTLPLLVDQAGATCIVVDYDCPESAGAWVERHHPAVKVVRSGPRPRFEIARARNLGGEAAESPWLCFVDADAVLAPEFAATVLPRLQPGGYYLADEDRQSLNGMCICRKEDFDRVGGYDAVLQGWGMEDKEFYARLKLAALAHRHFPANLVRMIPHGNEERVQHYDIKDGEFSSTLNLVYCRAKMDLMRMGAPEMDEKQRQRFYERISGGMKAAAANGTPFTLRVPLGPQPSLSGAILNGSLVYDIGPLARPKAAS